jgi:ACS family glucarate transporter-like MFS transporter
VIAGLAGRPPASYFQTNQARPTARSPTITRDAMQSNESETTSVAFPAAKAAVGDPPERPTRVRYLVLASACNLAVITYLHRVGFATAAAEFKTSLGLTDDDLGWLMAAFMIGYGIFEMPWGFLGDRFGVRHTVAVIVLGGSTLTALLVLVAFLPPQAVLIVGFLVVVRFLFGAFQAGTFPSIARMMADWMPASERGSAQGTIWMSSRIGGALAPLVLVWLFGSLGGWKLPVVLLGLLGILWCALFWPWFRNRPEEMRGVNDAERSLVLAGRSVHSGHAHTGVPWSRMVSSPSVWSLCMMYGFLGFSGNFYLTLLPNYLRHHRQLDAQTTAWLTSLPFAFGVVACLVGGSLSDAIIRRWGKAWSRRLVGVGGLSLAGMAIVSVPWADGTVALGFLLTLAFFGNDLAMAPAWAAAADIGDRYTGVLSGTMNMMASFMAALEARWLGRLFERNDDVLPFVLLACSYALGTFAWLGVDIRKTLRQSDKVED